MKILKSKREGDTFQLEIEEDQVKLTPFLDKAFQKLSQKVKLPGFRPGKIPRNVFEKNFGKEVLIEEAVMDLANEMYSDAIKELNLKVVDIPKNVQFSEYKENEPVKFTCEVDVLPLVKIGKYKGLKAKKANSEITVAEINSHLEQERTRRSKIEITDKPSAKDSYVILNITAKLEDAVFEEFNRKDFMYQIGTNQFLTPEFDSELINLNKNDKKNISLNLPQDFPNENLAGKTLVLEVEVVEVKERVLPELTDEFVKTNLNFDTLADFKNDVEKRLKEMKEFQNRKKLEDDLINQIIADIKVNLHPSMIDREINSRLKNLEARLQPYKISLEDYLKYNQKHIDELKNEIKVEAERALKSELVIDEICEKENIKVTDEDLTAEIAKLNFPEVKTLEEFKNKLGPHALINLEASIREKKFFDYIIKEAKISVEK